LSNICASNPRFCKSGLHAGLESRSAALELPLGKILLQPEILGNLKELLQKGGYRDFSRKVIPLPRLAANPTLKKRLSAKPKAQKYYLAPTAINYSSKLMSAAQELFQLSLKFSRNPRSFQANRLKFSSNPLRGGRFRYCFVRRQT
jgi:hypothetical protein